MKDSPLIQFYSGRHPFITEWDDGILFDETLKRDDTWWEKRHYYIQWMFPLKEKGVYNFHAPILTDDDIKKFKINIELQMNFDRAFVRYARFLGFERNSPYGEDAYLYEVRKDADLFWLKEFDHNHLRITRMLKSCNLISNHREIQAQNFFAALTDCVFNKNKKIIPTRTLSFWWDAANNF